MSTTIDVHEAEAQFSAVCGRVALGEEIIIANAGEPVAKFSPLVLHKTRTPGGAEGLKVPDTFFEPLPKDVLDALE